MTICYCL